MLLKYSVINSTTNCKKIIVKKNNKNIARLFLYFLKNDLQENSFPFIEDVFVNEEFRGQGIATNLIKKAISLAKKEKCYKIICTSRFSKEKVHKLYGDLGFKQQGIEFRIDL